MSLFRKCVLVFFEYFMMEKYFSFILLFVFCPYLHAASFDCHHKITPVESVICSDKALSKSDEEMSALYKIALKLGDSSSLRKDQRVWLSNRGECVGDECIRVLYKKRISEIKAYVSDRKICEKIISIYKNKYYSNYVVSLDNSINGPSEIGYKVDVDADGKKDSLSGECGNGYGSVCDFLLKTTGGNIVSFTVSSDVRLIRLNSSLYLVNGVKVAGDSVVVGQGFVVNRLLVKGIELICSNGGG